MAGISDDEWNNAGVSDAEWGAAGAAAPPGQRDPRWREKSIARQNAARAQSDIDEAGNQKGIDTLAHGALAAADTMGFGLDDEVAGMWGAARGALPGGAGIVEGYTQDRDAQREAKAMGAEQSPTASFVGSGVGTAAGMVGGGAKLAGSGLKEAALEASKAGAFGGGMGGFGQGEGLESVDDATVGALGGAALGGALGAGAPAVARGLGSIGRGIGSAGGSVGRGIGSAADFATMMAEKHPVARGAAAMGTSGSSEAALALAKMVQRGRGVEVDPSQIVGSEAADIGQTFKMPVLPREARAVPLPESAMPEAMASPVPQQSRIGTPPPSVEDDLARMLRLEKNASAIEADQQASLAGNPLRGTRESRKAAQMAIDNQSAGPPVVMTGEKTGQSGGGYNADPLQALKGRLEAAPEARSVAQELGAAKWDRAGNPVSQEPRGRMRAAAPFREPVPEPPLGGGMASGGPDPGQMAQMLTTLPPPMRAMFIANVKGQNPAYAAEVEAALAALMGG